VSEKRRNTMKTSQLRVLKLGRCTDPSLAVQKIVTA